MHQEAKYTPMAITLHWLGAVLIFGNLAFGLFMVDLPVSPGKLKFYSWHKWAGITIFLLSGLRLLWRLSHPPPALPPTMARWPVLAATASHHLLYALFFLAPLTGWLFSSAAGFQTVYFGAIPIPDLLAKNEPLADTLKAVHMAMTYSLAALVVAHVAAALKHHFADRDDVLVRMIPFLKPWS
jgi:cytochrome b561